jgi:hypothetical protein
MDLGNRFLDGFIGLPFTAFTDRSGRIIASTPARSTGNRSRRSSPNCSERRGPGDPARQIIRLVQSCREKL